MSPSFIHQLSRPMLRLLRWFLLLSRFIHPNSLLLMTSLRRQVRHMSLFLTDFSHCYRAGSRQLIISPRLIHHCSFNLLRLLLPRHQPSHECRPLSHRYPSRVCWVANSSFALSFQYAFSFFTQSCSTLFFRRLSTNSLIFHIQGRGVQSYHEAFALCYGILIAIRIRRILHLIRLPYSDFVHTAIAWTFCRLLTSRLFICKSKFLSFAGHRLLQPILIPLDCQLPKIRRSSSYLESDQIPHHFINHFR